MGLEIERKYLVNKEKWKKVEKTDKQFFRQGYLVLDKDKTIRVRMTDTQGFLTIKGKSISITRPEFEYEIPKSDAILLLQNFALSIITKIRYRIEFKNKIWEVDEFLDDNSGLILAEIELKYEGEHYELPGWIENDVSGDNRYYNSNLSVNPFKNWENE